MPKPGQVRRPSGLLPSRAPTGARERRIGPHVVTGSFPGQGERDWVIDPKDFDDQAGIADQLGRAWVSASVGRSFSTAHSGYQAARAFLKFLERREITEPSEILPDTLREFEVHLINAGPTVAAGRARWVWFLLSSVDGLPESTSNFVTHAPAIASRSSSPTDALTDDELKGILRATRRDVTQLRRRVIRSNDEPRFPWWYEITSLYILLLFETRLSMDVLKHLDLTDTGHTRVLDWNSNGGRAVEVAYRKTRGGATPPPLLLPTDGEFSAGSLLLTLRDTTEEARAFAASDAKFDGVGPWLGVPEAGMPLFKPFGESSRQPLVPMASIQSLFARWLDHHEITVKTFEGGRASFRAIRPAAHYQRIRLTDTTGLHMVDLVDDHTVDVYSRRYMRNKRLMHDLGRVFLENIAGVAEEVARHYEPTVVTPEMADNGEEHASAALDGDLEFGLTACKTPTDSPMPGQRSGDLCGLAFRACLVCPSAIVSPRHVTRLRTILAEANRQREIVPPPEWELMWGETVAFIEQALARLAPYEHQFPQEPANIIDVGLLGGDA